MSKDPQRVTRRTVLGSGAGLLVGIALSPAFVFGDATTATAPLPGSLNATRMLSAWLRINPDGTVTVFTGKVELGQGIVSALAQIAADELDVDYDSIVVVTADTSLTPDEGITAGSQSIEQSGAAIRSACAEARQILLEVAASRLSAAAAELTVTDGVIRAPGGGTLRYADVTAEAMLHREASGKPQIKGPAQHRLVGQSLARTDLPFKFAGGRAFIQDVRLSGMAHARVVRPPGPNARLEALDERVVAAMPGVIRVVRNGSFLGVVCLREEQAIAARTALQRASTWTHPSRPPLSLDAPSRGNTEPTNAASVVAQKTDGGASPSARRISAVYSRAFQLHASIGPSCALALYQGGKLTVWTHSQGVFALRTDLSRATGVDAGNIVCIHVAGAGCYGHNGADDVAFDAAILAIASPGQPIRLQWMRDDEFHWEPIGPAMTVELSAGLSASGAIVEWNHELWSYPHSRRPGAKDGVNLLAAQHLSQPLVPPIPADIPQPSGGADRNAIPLYEFPRLSVTKHFLTQAPVRTSALRSLGAYANVFAIESFLDEAAASAGVDPIAYRLRHLSDARARSVIESVSLSSGWRPGNLGDRGQTDAPVLRGRGIGFARYKNHACYCAVVADVDVHRSSGLVRVVRVWATVDAGLVINPDGIVNQIEGGIIQSASWTLKEALKGDSDSLQSSDWLAYPILRFGEVPEVDVELIRGSSTEPLGVGEGAQGPTAAAIGNAFHAATGRRLRDIPLSAERVRSVLA